MSGVALQRLDKWLFCKQHESFEVNTVAMASFNVQMPIGQQWQVCANRRHMLSDMHNLLLLRLDAEQSLHTF